MNRVINQFTTRAETYSASANWISDEKLINTHIEACGQRSAGHLLELCCGTGMVGRKFSAAGWNVCGIDLTKAMAEEANRFFPCICSPAEEVPFLDGAFDVVLLRQAYFLLDNGQKVLEQAHRVLKPGGFFVFSQTVPFSAEDTPWLEHIHRTKQAQLQRFFTEADLAEELERTFFSVRETRRLMVRENITGWLAAAPELSPEKQTEVCALIAGAPEPYRTIHKVEAVDGQVLEDWNWVIFTAERKPGR
ncbi:methyltransferase domain-containing protein [Geobacter pelophilus]|uniref:Methyltransferase domain-containing protein n=1 Tax=Geoanaerobacter pelophilus TaxID=60036 RepID=A0AAW4LB99_9BACT|nr:methyltransferase domain-containing protein [Geoanaerobacter pelophilus]MBT0665860.1 methyltransferase domain-containing protein [Geoanaerobacter pelophilus]